MNATAATALTFSIVFLSVVFSTASLVAVGLTMAALLVAWSLLPLLEEARQERRSSPTPDRRATTAASMP